MKKEIENRDDLVLLIDKFYSKLLKDKLIGHYFENLNLVEHLPRVVDFWAFVLLDENGYQVNVTEKHAHMKLKPDDFNKWVELFSETVDEFFIGEKAKIAKERAMLVSWTMNSKFNPNTSL